MSEESQPEYSIGELAERGGVSRRTVRYYVQRGLLEAPTGLGRGRHYTRSHLDRLIRIRDLQERGVPLTKIAVRLSEGAGPVTAERDRPPQRRGQSSWTRIEVADGVELHLRDRRLPPEQLDALRQSITRMLGEYDHE